MAAKMAKVQVQEDGKKTWQILERGLRRFAGGHGCDQARQTKHSASTSDAAESEQQTQTKVKLVLNKYV